MMKFRIGIYCLIFISLFTSRLSFGQIGINVNSPNKSAVLHISSITKGLLIPRLSITQRLALNNPAHALLVFDTDDSFFYFYDSTYNRGDENWTGLTPWLFRDNLSDYDNVNLFYKRDLFTHPSVRSVNMGTENPVSGNVLTVVDNIAIGNTDSTASANGMYVEGDLQGEKSVTVTNKVISDGFVGIGTMPISGIIMWSGNLADLPNEWELCDGNNGNKINGIAIPDLRGRFIVGYDKTGTSSPVAGSKEINTRGIGNVGGLTLDTLTTNEMPTHNHSGNTVLGGSHKHRYRDDYALSRRAYVLWPGNGNQGMSGVSDHTENTGTYNQHHDHVIDNEGGGKSHENRPPYYVLAFIIRTR
jgi:microcystin-dependent protein